MIKGKYGVVYTPDSLAEFVAILLKRFVGNMGSGTVIDPASGECSLLRAAKNIFGDSYKYFGIDVDKEAVYRTKKSFEVIHEDAILPKKAKRKVVNFWKNKFPTINVVIANPPWSSEKIYQRNNLEKAGYDFVVGQYDSYVLFIELAYGILCENGVMAFIIPDSLFDSQNTQLRKFLTEKTKIKVVARLGEKIFDEVSRATTVIICQKAMPSTEDETVCFRLTTDARKSYLAGNQSLISFFDNACHSVKQNRFTKNNDYNFDIDTRYYEEDLIDKIKSTIIDWNSTFSFGRGVEISKTGKIIFCPACNCAQGYKKQQLLKKEKKCTHCGELFPVDMRSSHNVVMNESEIGSSRFLVGENIRRYEFNGECYIRTNINGINYKNAELYDSPKLLVRKTGLGIYGVIDYDGRMTSQTVYILKYLDNNNNVPLEYFLALLNSRVVYYYYLKVYGENEWKSHPYLTKQILYTLPLRPYKSSKVDKQIVKLAKALLKKYDYQKDLLLEQLIMEKYELTSEEKNLIFCEMNSLPNLSSVNIMKKEE